LGAGSLGDQSAGIFRQVVATRDGIIVGVIDPATTERLPSDMAERTFYGGPPELDDAMFIATHVPAVEARLVPCPGLDASALEGSSTALLLGLGPAGGPYEYAWTTVDRP